ncbi:Cytochrome P450 71D8 [Hordeum vulgare]|nr:Cytochrome P450 71D8 [Hordeum vulgare]
MGHGVVPPPFRSLVNAGKGRSGTGEVAVEGPVASSGLGHMASKGGTGDAGGSSASRGGPRTGLQHPGPREKMTAKAAQAMINRFNEPLPDADMATIARLAKMGVDALKIASGMSGPDGVAMEAPCIP